MDEKYLEQLKNKRLIFTVTTGRSGTAYLSSLFGFARHTCAYHEPKPEFSDVFRDIMHGNASAREFWVKKKLPAIAREPALVYVETSHLTCKGFLDALLELGLTPNLIIHRRPARDVALSMLKMGTIPGRSDKGLRFYLSPADPGVMTCTNWQDLKDYQICFWYCLEIERRARFYKSLFEQKEAKVVETTLAELKTFSGVVKCFEGLNLKLKFPSLVTRIRFMRSAGVKVNESKETKKEIAIPEDLVQLESEVIQRIDQSELLNWLPEMRT